MKDSYSVVIVDDHSLVREGLKAVIAKNSKLRVVGEADNADAGYRLILKTRPDIVLLDIALHGSSGIELGKRLLQADSSLKIIMLTMHSKINYIISALEYGARGYILKDTSPDAILEGIQKVLEGELFVDSYISNKVISQLVHGKDKKDPDLYSRSSYYESLTIREQEIFRLLVNGCSLKQIAGELFISAKTVENHKTSIMSKLNCKNMVELVRFAFEIGLVEGAGS